MTTLMCNDCGWYGDDTELVSLSDDLDDRDFTHCPRCSGTDFEEEDDEGETE